MSSEVTPSLSGIAICKLAQKMGPVFIKMVQVLSTREDAFPPRMVKAFASMRETVPPESEAHVIQTLDASFGQSYKNIFSSFDMKPVGCGCVAQVHRAVLKTGEPVAVKVLRPNAEQNVRNSLKLARNLAKYYSQFNKLLGKGEFDVGNLLDSIEELLIVQTDLEQERRNIVKFDQAIHKNGFKVKNEHLIKIPKTFDSISSKTVLVMEFVEGIHPDLYKQVDRTPAELALAIDDLEDLMIIYNGLVHGDLHPGNFFWTKDGRIVLVGSSRVDLQACKLEYSIVSPK